MMKKILIFGLFLSLIATPIYGYAQDTKFADEIKSVETYLNNLTTVKSRFTQTTGDGVQLTGDFYMSRPGKLRFEYDEPVEDFIVADGTYIYFYDAEQKHQSHAAIKETLAGFLLRDDISLNGDITVQDVKRRDGLLKVSLVQTEDPGAGTLILGLKENPMMLEKWEVVDGHGSYTEIDLRDIKTGLKLKRRLFYYIDPEHGKVKYN